MKSSAIRASLLSISIVLAATLEFRPPLEQLLLAILHREGSSHGIFVPFISAYLLWRDRKALQALPQQTAVAGLFIAVFAIALHHTTQQNSLQYQAILFFIFLCGIIIFFFGTKIFNQVRFAIFFLATAIPLPTDIYDIIGSTVRSITLKGSLYVIKIFDIPMHNDGIFIYLPDITLKVARSCSGIRYLISYIVFGLLYAYLTRKGNIARIAVILSTIPMAIIAGIIRLSAITLAAYYIDPSMANYTPHVLLSWLVFSLVLCMALILDRFLRQRSNTSPLTADKA